VTTTDEPDDPSSTPKRPEQALADSILILRQEIDLIDQNIAALLKRRFELTRMILTAKVRSQAAAKDIAREALIMERVTRDIRHDSSLATALEAIYRCILHQSLRDGTCRATDPDTIRETGASTSEPTSPTASK
jgi:chorismate mutase